MQTSWKPKHSDALRDYLAKGLPYSEIARRINAEFNSDYTRNATIGRARRMGLAGLAETGRSRKPNKPHFLSIRRLRKMSKKLRAAKCLLMRPVLKRVRAPKLRCAEIEPRHLKLIELEMNDCRYPYGGDKDNAAITFCGHPQREGSSYCAAHFHLTRKVESAPERSAITALLRLVEAA